MIKKYSKEDLLFFALFFLIIFFFLSYRVYLNKISDIGLHFDEAQYWSWSKELAWGYFSKPPLIAWLISISSNLCGIEEYCVRMFSPLLHSASAFILGLSARIVTKNNYCMLLTAVLYFLMPGVVFSSFFITTDVPLLFFSSLITFCIIYILSKRDNNTLIWLLFSVSIGLGFLSKYALIYYIVSLIVATIYIPDLKKALINKRLFLILTISFAIFLPNIIWNFENGLVTFNHTADNGNFNHINFTLIGTLRYLLEQSFIIGIIPFLIILHNTINIKKLNSVKLFLLIAFLVPILFISVLSFFTRVNANWGIVGFPAGCLLVSLYVYEKNKRWITYSLLSTQILSAFIISYIFLFGLTKKLDPFYKHRTISELGVKVGKVISFYPQANFMSDDREDYSHMLYYLDPKPKKMAKWNGNDKIDDHFDLVTDTDSLAGQDVILLTRTKPTKSMIARTSGYEKIKEIKLVIKKNKVRNYNMFLLKNWVVTSEGRLGSKR